MVVVLRYHGTTVQRVLQSTHSTTLWMHAYSTHGILGTPIQQQYSYPQYYHRVLYGCTHTVVGSTPLYPTIQYYCSTTRMHPPIPPYGTTPDTPYACIPQYHGYIGYCIHGVHSILPYGTIYPMYTRYYPYGTTVVPHIGGIWGTTQYHPHMGYGLGGTQYGYHQQWVWVHVHVVYMYQCMHSTTTCMHVHYHLMHVLILPILVLPNHTQYPSPTQHRMGCTHQYAYSIHAHHVLHQLHHHHIMHVCIIT